MSDTEETSMASHLPTETRLWSLKRYTELHRRSLDDSFGQILSDLTTLENEASIEEVKRAYKELQVVKTSPEGT
ncbi:hypothetical protein ACFLTO_01255 [Chloroflexota bacterium]